MATEMADVVCPRCGASIVGQTYYGPCGRCRDALRDGSTITRPTAAPAAAPEASHPQAPAGAAVVSHLRTKRVHRDIAGPPPVLLDWEAGRAVGDRCRRTLPAATSLGGVLDELAPWADRVLVVDELAAALILDWATAPLPAGWRPGAHYLDGHNPAVTFHQGDRRVTLAPAAQWCGSGEYTVDQAHEGMSHAVELLDAVMPGTVRLLGSPATTGRELFARLIPAGREWHVLSDELQQEIRATSPQHRMELTQPAGMQLPGLHEVDMRLAYAALCWGLPSGEPVRSMGEPDNYRPQQRGRYLCRWTVPAGWDHLGILPARDGAGWRWPDQPGETARGWVDGSELALARRHGWAVDILESVVWPDGEGDPLRLWADKLAQASAQAERAGEHGRMSRQAAGVARAAIRACLVHGLGAFVGRRHTITHTIMPGDDAQPPEGAAVDVVWGTGAVVWREDKPAAWPAMSHPEWASAVWARTRCRLLSSPGGTGALAVPRADVIGLRGDALYLAHDPAWPDTGKPGGWRVKGDPLTAFSMPATLPALDHLRRRGADPARGLTAARAALTSARAAL